MKARLIKVGSSYKFVGSLGSIYKRYYCNINRLS